MTDTTTTQAPAAAAVRELPALGYPVSEDAVTHWFRTQYGRAPTEQELGAIIGAMANREAQSPRSGPTQVPAGWTAIPPAPPTRR